MNLLSIFSFYSAFIILIFGIIVFVKGENDNKRLPFFFFTLSDFLWLGAYSFAYKSDSQSLALLWFKIGYIGVIFIPPTWFHFTWNFRIDYLKLKNIKPIKFLIFILYTNAFYYTYKVLFSNDFIIGLFNYVWGPYPKVFVPLHISFILFFLLAFGSTLIFLPYDFFRNRKTILPIQLVRIKYLLCGVLVGAFAIVDFIPNYGFSFVPFGFLFMVPFPIIYAYAIIRYRLLDIRIAITRTGVFIVVYSLVLGVPFVLAFGLQEKLIKIFGVNWWILPLISSTLLATIGPFIYLYINKKAEDRLLKEQRSYQNILRNASSGMIRIKDLKRLLNVVVHVITKTVKIKYASVYILDKETNNFFLQAARGRFGSGKQGEDYIDAGSPLIWQLSLRKKPIVTEEEVMRLGEEAQNKGVIKFVEQLLKLNAALIVPSFVDDKLTGILILGEKASGKLYSEDDLVVFSVLANQSALAIENAQFYEEVKRTHEQLFQAEKMATIGTMADGLSHQINNRFHALSLIAGDSLDFLKHSDMSSFSAEAKGVLAELKSALERIENNVLQGGEVVKGLLKYSRPGDSGFELVSFKDVLNGSIDMVQYKIKLKEFDLVQNISDGVPKLYGNLTQLQEVFFNLIDNAYDAIKERQILLKEDGFRGKIEVSAIGVEGALEIIVADNGMGVKDLDKKKLFTPFFTTKATAKKGTGLGLYVLDKIIGAHNGKITIDSVYKSGTRFTITLPISPKS